MKYDQHPCKEQGLTPHSKRWLPYWPHIGRNLDAFALQPQVGSLDTTDWFVNLVV